MSTSPHPGDFSPRWDDTHRNDSLEKKSNIVMQKRYVAVLSIIILVVLITSCVPLWGPPPTLSGTQTLMSQELKGTITARAAQQGNTGQELETALANTTAIAQTTTAQAVLDNAAYQATATAILPVLEELPRYGVGALQGDVAWLHRPISINLNGYQQYGYANDFPEITAKDFVLAADISWNTQFGSSGCGFMFRSDANKKTPSQFMVLITRFAYGTLVFSAMVDGNVTNMQVYYPWTKDKAFNWQNDTTNRLVVVARGRMMDIYTNGVKIAELDTTRQPPSTLNLPAMPDLPTNPSDAQLQGYQQQVEQNKQISQQMAEELLQAQQNYNANRVASISDGFLGFLGMSTAGSAVCKFSNAWLFLLRPLPTETPTSTPTFNGTPATSTPTLTLTPTRTYFISPTPSFTNTFVIGPQPTAVPAPATAVPPTATQPPVPTATQPPVTP
jgi:hypothetical protein